MEIVKLNIAGHVKTITHYQLSFAQSANTEENAISHNVSFGFQSYFLKGKIYFQRVRSAAFMPQPKGDMNVCPEFIDGSCRRIFAVDVVF